MGYDRFQVQSGSIFFQRVIHVSWLVAIDVCPKLENIISIGPIVKKKSFTSPIQKDVLCLIGTGQRSRWKPSRSSGSSFRRCTWFATSVARYALIISDRPRLRGALRRIPKFLKHPASEALEATRSHSKWRVSLRFRWPDSDADAPGGSMVRRFEGSTCT